MNNYESQKLRGIKRKYEAILSRGAKCEKCGYDKNISALEFHHLESKEKDFHLGSAKTTNIDKLRKEVEKCILVCSNCHKEIHYPQNQIKDS